MTAWIEYLARQERSVTSRLGAGWTISRLWTRDRWVNECAEDLQISRAEAVEICDHILRDLVEAVGHGEFSGASVVAAKSVYADWSSRPSPKDEVRFAGNHLVYKLYDHDDKPLYVGITSRGPQRLVEHHRTKSWFKDVETVLFERFGTREQSAAREVVLIKELKPAFNVQHNRHQARLGTRSGPSPFGVGAPTLVTSPSK